MVRHGKVVLIRHGKVVLFATIAALAGTIMASQPANATCSARFTCNPGTSPTCYFAILDGKKAGTLLTVSAGQAKTVYGLDKAATFCSSTSPFKSNLGDELACALEMKNVNMSCN
jgi:hypothetical protein